MRLPAVSCSLVQSGAVCSGLLRLSCGRRDDTTLYWELRQTRNAVAEAAQSLLRDPIAPPVGLPVCVCTDAAMLFRRYPWVFLHTHRELLFTFHLVSLYAICISVFSVLTHVGFRAHVKIASRVVSYRIVRKPIYCSIVRGYFETLFQAVSKIT